jgi:hypothetical protein
MRRELNLSKRIEVLRAFFYSKEHHEDKMIQSPRQFTEGDVVSMELFKKVFMTGASGLNRFIGYIAGGAEGISEYSVQYYVAQLKNGLNYQYVKKVTSNFRAPYFRNPPDVVGCNRHFCLTDLQYGPLLHGDLNGAARVAKETSPEWGCGFGIIDQIAAYRYGEYSYLTRTKIPYHVEQNARNLMVMANGVEFPGAAGPAKHDAYQSFKKGYWPTSFGTWGSYRVDDLASFMAKSKSWKDISADLQEGDLGLHWQNLLVNPWKDCFYRNEGVTPARSNILYQFIPRQSAEDGKIVLDRYVATDLSSKLFQGVNRTYEVLIPLSGTPEDRFEKPPKPYKLHTYNGMFGYGQDPESYIDQM